MGQLSSRSCAGSPWGGTAGCQGGGAPGSGCWQRKTGEQRTGAEPERRASQSRRLYAAGSPHHSWQSTEKHTDTHTLTVTNNGLNKCLQRAVISSYGPQWYTVSTINETLLCVSCYNYNNNYNSIINNIIFLLIYNKNCTFKQHLGMFQLLKCGGFSLFYIILKIILLGFQLLVDKTSKHEFDNLSLAFSTLCFSLVAFAVEQSSVFTSSFIPTCDHSPVIHM